MISLNLNYTFATEFAEDSLNLRVGRIDELFKVCRILSGGVRDVSNIFELSCPEIFHHSENFIFSLWEAFNEFVFLPLLHHKNHVGFF